MEHHLKIKLKIMALRGKLQSKSKKVSSLQKSVKT